MIGLALKLWQIKAVRGATLGVGVLVAVVAGGGLLHRDGYAKGRADQKVASETAWNADAALARAAALTATTHATAIIEALRDSLSESSRKIALLSETAALARGQYREALLQYNLAKAHARDSLPTTDIVAACDALANRCAIAIATAQDERDALTEKLRQAEALAAQQTRMIEDEPVRWKPVIADALSQQRAGFHAPSRTAWSVGGAVLGSLLTLLVR